MHVKFQSITMAAAFEIAHGVGIASHPSLEAVIARDALALIKYWSVGPSFDGETFCSKWQDYRDGTGNGTHGLQVARKAEPLTPKVKGKHTVFLKEVDVFGFEGIVVAEVAPR